MNEVINTILNRRSHRAYENRDISSEDKELIIDSIMRAPTAGNMMLYTILEVDDQKIKEKLVETCDDQPFIAKSPFVLVFLADLQRWYDYFKLSGVESPQFPGVADLLLAASDANIAAQNGVIAAESLGIGSCYIGDIMENYEIHRELFDLPNYVFPVAMLCFGYKKESDVKTLTTRFPTKYIHQKGKYQRFSPEDFEELFKGNKIKNFIEGAENLGQHFYHKKIHSTFMKEMRRSVKEGLKSFQE